MMNKIEEAFKILSNAIHSDAEYAFSWESSLAVPIMDEGVSQETSNLAAARIMRLLFDYDMEDNEIYNSLMSIFPTNNKPKLMRHWFRNNKYRFTIKQYINFDDKVKFGKSMADWYYLIPYDQNGRKF